MTQMTQKSCNSITKEILKQLKTPVTGRVITDLRDSGLV